MKKYLYLLIVALFSTMSFALTSCGDDDDEPNGDNATNSALTIDGVAYKVINYQWAQVNKTQDVATFQIMAAVSDDEYPNVDIVIDAKAIDAGSKGKPLNITNSKIKFYPSYGVEDKYDDEVSGNVTVENITSDKITLKFNDYKLSDGSSNKTIKGSITLDLVNY